MNWYEDFVLSRLIAEEKITPRERRYRKVPGRVLTTPLHPLLRALLSWLF